LVTHRDYIKKRLIDILKEEIVQALPPKIRHNKNERVVSL